MYLYQEKDNKIIAYIKIDNEKDVPSYLADYQQTDREIANVGGNIFFTDTEEYAQAKAEEENAKEEQALKPTVDDLAEALDILTNIVLGGE